MKKNLLVLIILVVAVFLVVSYFPIGDKIAEEPFLEEVIESPEGVVGEEQVGEETTEETEEAPAYSFVGCLADAGLVFYGSATCPYCVSLVEELGGYEQVAPLYVDCNRNRDRCSLEMQTNYVPEIQIRGKIYDGPRDLDSISKVANCPIK